MRTFWSDQEINILKQWYGKITVKNIIKKYLPYRTVPAIKLQARNNEVI